MSSSIVAPPEGIAGADLPGILGAPGTGGAPLFGPEDEAVAAAAGPSRILPPVCGADLSFVTAFFSFIPFRISPKSASVLGAPPGGGFACPLA